MIGTLLGDLSPGFQGWYHVPAGSRANRKLGWRGNLTENARTLSEVPGKQRSSGALRLGPGTSDKGVRRKPLARRRRAPSSYGF